MDDRILNYFMTIDIQKNISFLGCPCCGAKSFFAYWSMIPFGHNSYFGLN